MRFSSAENNGTNLTDDHQEVEARSCNSVALGLSEVIFDIARYATSATSVFFLVSFESIDFS